jgi:type I restriction enzyme S subunit
MSKLPKGWTIRSLGGKDGIATVINGSTPSTDEPRYWDGDILWATPSDLGKFRGIYLSDTERKITEAGLNSCSTNLVPAGTVIMTSRAPVGNLAIAGKELCTNQGFKNFVIREGVNSEYLYLYLKYLVPQIQKDSHGNTFTEITKSQVEKIKICIPEKLEDQIAIARDLQSQLAHVESMRQAALKQKEAAKALQSAILREVFPWRAGESLPSGWRWEKVGKYAKFKNGLNYSSSDIQSGVKIVGVSCFQDNFYLDEVNDVEIREERVREEDYLKRNDILIVRSNGSADLVGRHLLYIGKEKVTHSGFTIRLRLDEAEINPLFYMYFARSDFFKNQTKGQGANIKNVSQAKLSKVDIPLPETIEKQLAIVETIQRKFESTQKTIAIVDTQLAAIEALPAAILRDAFAFETECHCERQRSNLLVAWRLLRRKERASQ